jgi:CheY-like chemotaxis protein
LVHHFKRWRAHIPVIVLGEYSALPAAVRVMRAGAAEFIEKPFIQRPACVCGPCDRIRVLASQALIAIGRALRPVRVRRFPY